MRLKVEDEIRDAFASGARLRLGVKDEEIGDRSIRDPSLFSGDLPPARELCRDRPNRPKVAAGVGLGQRRRADQRAVHQFGTIARDLLGCSLPLDPGDAALHVD